MSRLIDPLKAAFAECEAVVRRDDPDRAVSVAFAPVTLRRYLNALYAFDIETAKIRDLVSQPLPGEIRLQWWRDRIDAHASDPFEASGQGSPVAAALLDTIAAFDLPADAFRMLLEARIFDLYDDPMPGRTEFEAYAGETNSAVMMLAAMVLDRTVAPIAADPAGHAGVARLAVDVVRLLPKHRSRRQVFVPGDVLDAVGCSSEALLRGDAEATKRVIATMAAYARDHLEAYRRSARSLPASLQPVFLPIEMTEQSLRRLESGAAVFPQGTGPTRRLFTYWRAMRRS